MIGKFFASPGPETPAPIVVAPRVPDGVRVYAIGDIHGRADLLRRLLDMIDSDAGAQKARETVLVFVGDYIDRGPDSRDTIDMVIGPHRFADRVVTLRGNHEDAMFSFVRDPNQGRFWIDYGGIPTMLSYGVRLDPRLEPEERLQAMSDALARQLPDRHFRFFEALTLSETIGDYFFVHAGIDPRIPIARQSPFDLITIRQPFLEWGQPLEKVVVHGHSIAPLPEFRPWRIGIDTGAFHTGRLTCLVLEGDQQRIIAT